MLKNLLDMGVYLYTMVGSCLLGVLILSVMSSVQMKKVQNRKALMKLAHRINGVKAACSTVVLAVTAAVLGITVSEGQVRTLGMQYGILGIGLTCVLILYGKYLAFANRDRLLGEYLFRMMEQQNQISVPVPIPEPPSREQLVERALQGIRECAANGESRFAHLLSQEEEAVMREVINEFITEG